MSDTPRTDAESGTALDWPYYAKVVPADFARQLERDLAAANERIAALERERDAQREEVDLLTSRCLEYERDIAALEWERDALIAHEQNHEHRETMENIDLRAEVERLRALLRECVEAMEEYRSLEEFTGNNSEWCKRIRAALGEE